MTRIETAKPGTMSEVAVSLHPALGGQREHVAIPRRAQRGNGRNQKGFATEITEVTESGGEAMGCIVGRADSQASAVDRLKPVTTNVTRI